MRAGDEGGRRMDGGGRDRARDRARDRDAYDLRYVYVNVYMRIAYDYNR